MHDIEDLIDPLAACNRIGVSRTAFDNWKRRYPNFPAPLVTLGRVPVYSWAELKAWVERQFGIARFKGLR